jgi:hypothetical protein
MYIVQNSHIGNINIATARLVICVSLSTLPTSSVDLSTFKYIYVIHIETEGMSCTIYLVVETSYSETSEIKLLSSL